MERMINETRLLWKAEQALEALGEPTAERLAEVVAADGIDLATALLYLHLRKKHARFVQAVDGFEPHRPLPRLEGELWLVPAAGWRERPEYGGDGAVLREIGEDFGLPTRFVAATSLGSVSQNARLLRDALASAAPRSVVLVTLSKGAAELKVALREPGPHRDALRAWLNVGGLAEGTPLLTVGPTSLRHWLPVRLMMLLRQIDPGFVSGLRHRTPLLDGPVEVPPHVPVVSVVGFPLRCHLDGTIAGRHELLAPLGPNDGYGLCLDAIAPGDVYPVWGASHYLRVAGLSRVFYGILARFAST